MAAGTSSFDRMVANTRTGLFGMLYVMSKQLHVAKRATLVAFTIKFLQFLAFPLSDGLAVWTESDSIYPFTEFLRYISAKKIDKSLSPVAFRILLAIAGSWVGGFLLLAGWVGYSFANGLPQNGFLLRLLRSVAKMSTSFLFLPFTSIMLRTLACPDGYDGWMDTGWVCGETEHIILSVFMMAMVVMFSALSVFVASTFIDRNPGSPSWSAKIHGRVTIAMLVVKLLLAFLFNVLDGVFVDTWYLTVLLILTALVWVGLHLHFMPFVHAHINAVEIGFGTGYLWCTLALALAQLSDGRDMTFFVYLGTPLVIGFGYLLGLQYERRLAEAPLADLTNVHKIAVWARNRIHHSNDPDLNDGLLSHLITMRADAARKEADAARAAAAAAEASNSNGDKTAGGARRRAKAPKKGGLFDSEDPSEQLEVGVSPEAAMLAQQKAYYLQEATRAVRHALDEFPESEMAALFAAAFFKDFGSFHYQEVLTLARTTKLNPAIDFQYFIYQRSRQLREADDSGLSPIDRVLFDQQWRESRMLRVEAYRQLVLVWETLAQRMPDLAHIQEAGIQLQTTLQRIEGLYNSMLQINPDSTSVLRAYAMHLMDLSNEPTKAMELLNKADRIEEVYSKQQNKTLRHVDLGVVSDQLSALDERSAVLTISGDPGNIGEILSVSAAACRIYGYNASQMVGQNIAMIVPQPIRAVHSPLMRKFERRGTSRLINKSRLLFAQNRSGALFPVWMQVMEAPPDEVTSAPRFTAVMQPVLTDESHILFGTKENDFRIYGATERSITLLGIDPESIQEDSVSMLTWFPSLAPTFTSARTPLATRESNRLRAVPSFAGRLSDLDDADGSEAESGAAPGCKRASVDGASAGDARLCPIVGGAMGAETSGALPASVRTGSTSTAMRATASPVEGSSPDPVPRMMSFHGTPKGTMTAPLRGTKSRAAMATSELVMQVLPLLATKTTGLIPIVNTTSSAEFLMGSIQVIAIAGVETFYILRWHSLEDYTRPFVEGRRGSITVGERRKLAGRGDPRDPRLAGGSTTMMMAGGSAIARGSIGGSHVYGRSPKVGPTRSNGTSGGGGSGVGGGGGGGGGREGMVGNGDGFRLERDVDSDVGSDVDAREGDGDGDSVGVAFDHDSPRQLPATRGPSRAAGRGGGDKDDDEEEDEALKSLREIDALAATIPTDARGGARGVVQAAPPSATRGRAVVDPTDSRPLFTAGIGSGSTREHAGHDDGPVLPSALALAVGSAGAARPSAHLASTPSNGVLVLNLTNGVTDGSMMGSQRFHGPRTPSGNGAAGAAAPGSMATGRRGSGAEAAGISRGSGLAAGGSAVAEGSFRPFSSAGGAKDDGSNIRGGASGMAGSVDGSVLSGTSKMTTQLRRALVTQVAVVEPEIRRARYVLLGILVATLLMAIVDIVWMQSAGTTTREHVEGVYQGGERFVAFESTLKWIWTAAASNQGSDHEGLSVVDAEIRDALVRFQTAHKLLGVGGSTYGSGAYTYDTTTLQRVVEVDSAGAITRNLSMPLSQFGELMASKLATVDTTPVEQINISMWEIVTVEHNEPVFARALNVSMELREKDFVELFPALELQLVIGGVVAFVATVFVSTIFFVASMRSLGERTRSALLMFLLIPDKAAKSMKERATSLLNKVVADDAEEDAAGEDGDDDEAEKEALIEEDENADRWQQMLKAIRTSNRRGTQRRQFTSSSRFMTNGLLRLLVPVLFILGWILFLVFYQLNVNAMLQRVSSRMLMVQNQETILVGFIHKIHEILHFPHDRAEVEEHLEEIHEYDRQMNLLAQITVFGGKYDLEVGSTVDLPRMSAGSKAFVYFFQDGCHNSPVRDECRAIEGGVLKEGLYAGLAAVMALGRSIVASIESAALVDGPNDLMNAEREALYERLDHFEYPHIRFAMERAVAALKADVFAAADSAITTVVAVSSVFTVCFFLFTFIVYWPLVSRLAIPLQSARSLLGVLPDEMVHNIPDLRYAIHALATELQMQRNGGMAYRSSRPSDAARVEPSGGDGGMRSGALN